jgi:ribosome-interacting GTPase 1
MIREDIDEDQLIDILIGNRKYVPCLYVRRLPSAPFSSVTVAPG